MNCISVIKGFDFVSNEVKLTINQRKTRLKTLFGGLLSLASILIMIGFGLYFFIKFLQKDSIYITSSMKYSENTKIVHSNDFPFLIRLTDKENKPFPNPESIYKIHLKYWFTDDTNGNFQQSNEDIQIELCDINVHFSHFRNLFEDIKDLNTFYCTVPRPSNMTIFGKYGDLSKFGYYHFYIQKCDKDINPKCLSADAIESITENIYLDFRTIDYDMDSKNNNVKHSTVLSHRHMLSNSVYKRIWFYLREIDYITDDGLFFVSESTDYFSKYDSMRYDIDLRDITEGTVPGTFATMTILSTGTVYIYNRKYLKLQEYLASIGGIIAFIQKIAGLLNIIYSMNTYYIHFMNEFDLFHPESKSQMDSLDTSNQGLFNLNPNIFLHRCELLKPKLMPQANKVIVKKRTKKKKKFDSWWFKCVPYRFHSREDALFFKKCIDTICSLINITLMIKKIEKSHLLTKSLTNCKSNKIYNTQVIKSFPCPLKQFEDKTEFKKAKSIVHLKWQNNQLM